MTLWSGKCHYPHLPGGHIHWRGRLRITLFSETSEEMLSLVHLAKVADSVTSQVLKCETFCSLQNYERSWATPKDLVLICECVWVKSSSLPGLCEGTAKALQGYEWKPWQKRGSEDEVWKGLQGWTCSSLKMTQRIKRPKIGGREQNETWSFGQIIKTWLVGCFMEFWLSKAV